jgi:hypothetical protein
MVKQPARPADDVVSAATTTTRGNHDDMAKKRKGSTKSKPKSKSKTPKAPRRYRDSATGRFVTKKYAKKHRKTTIKESAADPA